MSEVKRFMPVINDKPYKPYAYCTENEDGIYVRLSDYAELKAQRDALAANVKQLEWDSVFIPNDLDRALTVMGVALPESKEEFNFSINRWVQRLVDQVIRFGPELDAERNNLRAEGADKVAEYHFVRIEALKEVSRQGYLFHKAAYADAANVANLFRAAKDGK